MLVPTLSCFYGVAGRRRPAGEPPAETWSPLLVELAEHNLEQADLTLRAASAAGVRIAIGLDWAPLGENAIEIVRMVQHGLTPHEALTAATATAADALGLGEHVGTIEPGQLADLVVVDGDPLADPAVLLDRDRIWLVLQLGRAGGRGDRAASVAHDPPSARAGRVLHEQRDLDAVLDLELGQQPRHVRLDRRDAHVQLGGDLGVRAARADRERDLVLARGQRREPLARPLAAGGLVARRRRRARSAAA